MADIEPTQSIETIRKLLPRNGMITDYVDWAVRTTHAPPQFHLFSILPPLAFELARRGYIGPDGLPLRVWSLLVGGAGTAKGTAIRRAKNFLTAFHDIENVDMTEDPYTQLHGSVQGIVDTLTHRYDPELDRTPGMLYTEEFSDVLTWERTSEMLCQIFDGISIQRNFRHLQRAAGQGADVRLWLMHPIVSGIFSIPSRQLERVARGEHVEGGLFSRILWTYGEIDPKQLMEYEIQAERERVAALVSWQDRFKELLAREVTDPSKTFRLSPAARDVNTRMFEMLRDKMAAEKGALQSLYTRLLTYIRIVECLYAGSRGDTTIDETDAEAALNVCLHSAQSIETLAESTISTGDKDYALQQKILAVLRKPQTRAQHPDGVPRKVFYTAFGCSQMALQTALDALCDRGLVDTRIKRKEPGKAGRPSQVVILLDGNAAGDGGGSSDPDGDEDADGLPN